MAKQVIQHICAGLVFLVGLVFFVLNLCGVSISVKESDINTAIFALASFIAIAIELIPFLVKLIKEKNLLKIMNIVKTVIEGIEEIEDLSSAKKKAKARELILIECQKEGLNVDVTDINNLIEAAVALHNRVVES